MVNQVSENPDSHAKAPNSDAVVVLPRSGDPKLVSNNTAKQDTRAEPDPSAAPQSAASSAAAGVAVGAAVVAMAAAAGPADPAELSTNPDLSGAAAAAAVASGAGAAADAAAAADDESVRKQFEEKFISILTEISQSHAPAAALSKPVGQPRVLARLIVLSRKLLDSDGNYGLYRQAYFAALLLKTSPDNVGAINEVIDDIEFSTSRNSPVYSVMKGLISSVLVQSVAGTALIAIFTVPYFVLSGEGFANPSTMNAAIKVYLGLWTSPLVISVVFGILGSVVSILLRLSEFEGARRRSRQFLTMTGAMLPLVGGIFGAVTCALFASGIVNFQFANAGAAISTPYFYVVIGFLSGFSERFTRGLLDTATPAIGGSLRADIATDNSAAK